MRRARALAIALVALAACGGGDATPFEIVSSARDKTLDAHSARLVIVVKTAATPDGGQPFEITSTGAYDFGDKIGVLSMDLSAVGLPGAGGKADVILAGDVFYLKLPSALGALVDKPWLKIDLATLGRQSGVDLSSLQQLRQNDPTSALNYLEGVGGDDIRELGEVEVRGENTRHYGFTVDLERAKAQVAADLRDDYDQIIAQLGSSTFPAELWVDGDERVRRIRFTLDPPPADGADAPPVVVTEDFFDFGTEVEASPPPSDQVTDYSQLLAGANP